MSLKNLLFLFLIIISLPGFTQEEDDVSQELLEKREQRAQELKKVEETTEALSSVQSLADLSKVKGALPVFDPKFQKTMTDFFANNPFATMPREQVRNLLLEKYKGSKFEAAFTQYPVLLDILTDVVRDGDAIPGIMKLLTKKKELRRYLLIWIGLIIFTFLIRKHWLKPKFKKSGFMTRAFASLAFSIFSTVASFYIFYSMFKPELKPFVTIVMSHL